MVARGEDVEAAIRRLYREVELAVREATMLVGHDATVIASLQAEDQVGMPEGSLVGGPPLPEGWSMFDETGRPLAAEAHPALVALRTGEVVEQVVAYADPAGSGPRLVRITAHPVTDDPEVAVDVALSDPARRERTRDAIERQEARFRTLADMVPVAIWEASPAGEITYVNPTFTALTGLTAEEAPDLPMLEIVHPDDLLAVMEAAGRTPEEGEYSAQYRVRHVDGSSRWVRSQLSLLIDDDGKMSGFVGSIEDIDDLRRSEQAANRLADIVESAGDAVAVFEDDTPVYLNPAATTLLERTDPGYRAEPRRHVFGELVIDRHLEEIRPTLVADGRWSGEVRLADADGAPVDLSLTVTAEVDPHGQIGRIVLMAHDIRDQKRREAALVHGASHDPLTGLANRHRLEESVRAGSDDPQVAALYVDIDHFKRINDDHGHTTGDGVLVEVSDRLARAVRASDLVARVGGDEIVVWAPATSPSDASALAERLVAAINAHPVRVGGRSHAVTVTIGVAVGEGTDETDLIRRADGALYRAKQTGRNRWLMSEAPGPSR